MTVLSETLLTIWGILLLIIGVASGLLSGLLSYAFASGTWLSSNRNTKSFLTLMKDPVYVLEIVIAPSLLITSGVYGLLTGNPLPLMASIIIQYFAIKIEVDRDIDTNVKDVDNDNDNDNTVTNSDNI